MQQKCRLSGLFCALFLLLCPGAFAQSKLAEPSPEAEKLLNAYCFDEASELIEKQMAQARRKKLNTSALEELLDQARKGSEMLFGTEKVVFVDSAIVSRTAFLSAYRLSRETGKIGLLSHLLPGFGTTDSVSDGVCYVNELGDKAYMALPDSSGATRLFLSNRWGDEWGRPEPLKGIGDSATSEAYPFVMADGVTLYYAAQGPESLGGFDIFVTRYNSDNDRFVRPENIGMPFNSPANDYLYVIDEATGLGWFATDRNQPADKVCIYSFIPNESREVYDITAVGDDYVRNAARIASIASTQANRNYVAAARKRLADVLADEQASGGRMARFVINDRTVYTRLSQFKKEAARKLAAQWLKGATQLRNMQAQLDAMRRQYGTRRDASLKKEIFQMERDVATLEQSVGQLAKSMREAELK